MGYWGIAMSLYQQLWATTPTVEEVQRARNALAQVQPAMIKTAREKAYLDAIAIIYPPTDSHDNNSYSTRKLAYEQAMQRIAEQFPDDSEATLFGISLAAQAAKEAGDLAKAKQYEQQFQAL